MGGSTSCGSTSCGCGKAPNNPVLFVESSGGGGGPSMQSLNTWEFDILELDSSQLGAGAVALLEIFHQGCGASDQDQGLTLVGFVNSVRDGYLTRPYHNFCHGVDVLQTLFYLGSALAWDRLFQPAERFALLVAALAHDIGHPGLCNSFLIDTRHEFARRFNDISPLENMHCSSLFQILQRDHAKVFGHLPQQEQRNVRKLIIDAILHTDPAHHEEIVSSATELYANNAHVFKAANAQGFTEPQVDLLRPAEPRRLVARVLLLGADLSNQTKPWSLARRWAELMQEEHFAQGDRECELGFVVPPLHDRSAMSLPEVQLQSIQFTIAPLVVAEMKVFPSWHELGSMLAANARKWRARFSTKDKQDAWQADHRVECITVMLEPPKELEHELIDCEVSPEPCSEPSCPEPETMPPLVREVQRWREASASTGRYRELVMLCIISDEAGSDPNGRPVLFRYARPDASQMESEAAPSEADAASPASPTYSRLSAPAGYPGAILEEQSEGEVTAMSLSPSRSMTMPVDNAPRESKVLNSRKFDSLMGHFLEDCPAPPVQSSEIQKSECAESTMSLMQGIQSLRRSC